MYGVKLIHCYMNFNQLVNSAKSSDVLKLEARAIYYSRLGLTNLIDD